MLRGDGAHDKDKQEDSPEDRDEAKEEFIECFVKHDVPSIAKRTIKNSRGAPPWLSSPSIITETIVHVTLHSLK